jgi:hypothetical protein
MRNLLSILSLIFFFGVMFISCEKEKELSWREENAAELARLYPNESTELAWIMREMAAKTEEIKEQVKKGDKPSDLSSLFSKIHGAESMRPEAKTEAFKGMANSFVSSFQNLQQSSDDEMIKSYNLMIQNCVICHTTYCPGPLVKIKKLAIEIP